MNEVEGVVIADEREAEGACAVHEPQGSLRAPEFSVKRVKTQGPATSIVSFDPAPAKPLMRPANPDGSCSASSPPLPVNEAVWPALTIESNSRVEAPETMSFPVPYTPL